MKILLARVFNYNFFYSAETVTFSAELGTFGAETVTITNRRKKCRNGYIPNKLPTWTQVRLCE